MPKRRRHGQRPPAPIASAATPDRGESTEDPVSQFGRMLKESAEREAAEQRRREEQRRAARAKHAAARTKADELGDARRELDRAIDDVRRARASGRGRAEADAAWRAAKARVIELESGERPDWAPPPPVTDDAPAGDDGTDEADQDRGDDKFDDADRGAGDADPEHSDDH